MNAPEPAVVRPSPDGELRDDAANLLAHTAFTVMGTLTRLAAGHDLSLTQLRVLGILRDHSPRMTALATFLGLEKSSLSGLVARAEARGLVARFPDPADARATRVALTSGGQELAVRVLGELRDALAPLAGRLTAAEWDALTGLLARLNEPAGR